MTRSRRRMIWLSAALLFAFIVAFLAFRSNALRHLLSRTATIADRQSQYGPAARSRFLPDFQKAGIAYPPARLALIAIKDQKSLEVYAAGPQGAFVFVRAYSILAASGHAGPKLREGDMQVPEGIYPIESLNPNSGYHLALHVGYPNDFDRRQAQADGRANLGGDIMIHGGNGSAGCLAMGDEAAEDLFVLVADTGIAKTQLILTPVDFREPSNIFDAKDLPAWSGGLYAEIKAALAAFPLSKMGR